MGRHKRAAASHGNTMEQYTTPVVLPKRVARLEVSGDAGGTPLNTEEPSRVKLLAAFQSSRVALEGKIEMVAVSLLRVDLRKVPDKVKVAKSSIAELQTEGSGGVTRQASGAESPDWRSHGTGRLADSRHRVEIQQDGTMAMVAADSVGGKALEQELGAGGDCGMT
ncbi:hypothetical protein NDU88_001377 [Pleurodeles waltl]|uniref:Uncharacterized protein n=1 Tax=Pleurodeles waltl TaxID=8319 RepID=A0AAV7LFT0_PLEWA|nr:hypothetical protein NDU88_001377 [Pleurodeles waltl]